MSIAQPGKESGVRSLLLYGLAVVAIVLSGFALVMSFGSDSTLKTGVVRTGDLIAGYKGMDDAKSAFQERQKQLRGGVDTLEADYQATVHSLDADWSELSEGERQKRTELLKTQEQNLLRYTQNIEVLAQEEQEELWDEVLRQVNDVVEVYAEKHDYDVILGATSDGSILYSTESLDITDDLIEALNKSYENSK